MKHAVTFLVESEFTEFLLSQKGKFILGPFSGGETVLLNDGVSIECEPQALQWEDFFHMVNIKCPMRLKLEITRKIKLKLEAGLNHII